MTAGVNVLSQRDAAELDWWRHFASKVAEGLPDVGSPLTGQRFVVCEDTP